MNLQRLFAVLYQLLYHTFAWSYDLVAAVVSLGQWRNWVLAIQPLIHGETVLELGFGPGHLQTALARRGLRVFGLDESAQMARQAARMLTRAGLPVRVSRGLAQALPFAPGSVQTVVATFPAPYIFDPHTAAEIARVLDPGGQVVILLSVWVSDRRLAGRVLRALFQASGQTSPQNKPLSQRVHAPYQAAGLHTRELRLDAQGTTLLILLAEHPGSAC